MTRVRAAAARSTKNAAVINERGLTMDFVGTWHIYEMEMWDEDYFNMEVQAYITMAIHQHF